MQNPLRKNPRASRSRNLSLQLATVQKRLEELLVAQRKHSASFEEIKREIEDLRRDFNITMESLADLPYVSGSLH
jgi:hypothetical protein